jgi:hypothetical protein
MLHFYGNHIMASLMFPFTRVLSTICFVTMLASPIMGMAVSSGPGAASNTPAPVATEPGSQKSIEQLAREMTNPLAAFYRFDYEGQYRTFQGDIAGADDQTSWIHNFQVTLPFRQKDGKGWVFKFALPYYDDQPVYWVDRGYAEWLIRQQDPTTQGEGYWEPTHGHTEDVSFDLVYGGVSESGRILSYGLAGILPTSSDTSNARQQLILGPAVNIGKMTDWGVYGAVISQIFDVAEKRDKGTPDTSQTTIQVYFSYGLENGWQLTSNPIITYDWEGDSGNKLNLPLGGGIAKTTKIGQVPIRLGAEFQYYVASTDRFGPDWLFKFSVSSIIPSKYTRN